MIQEILRSLPIKPKQRNCYSVLLSLFLLVGCEPPQLLSAETIMENPCDYINRRTRLSGNIVLVSEIRIPSSSLAIDVTSGQITTVNGEKLISQFEFENPPQYREKLKVIQQSSSNLGILGIGISPDSTSYPEPVVIEGTIRPLSQIDRALEGDGCVIEASTILTLSK